MIEIMNSHRDLELYASLLRHDLKNDLQAIFSNSEAIQLLSDPESEVIEFSEAVIAAVERMIQLLDIFGRPDKDFEKEILPLVEYKASQAAKADVALKISIDARPEIFGLSVVGGRLLPMVFDNIFRNAAKYAGPNPEVYVSLYRQNEHVIIEISDNGPGISESILPKLFEKGGSTSGSGLGLYLSKRVLKAYGGSIELVHPRKKNRGATFRIELLATSE